MKKINFIFLFFFITSCADYNINKKKKTIPKSYYTSKGFALIYEEKFFKEKLISKKINNNKIAVMHNFLKTNTPIKITNPINEKVVTTKVHRNADFPKIFNLVISKEIANLLELDVDNPYVVITEFKKNKTFIAKESNTFEEEKNVAETAPVAEVEMDVLSNDSENNLNTTNKQISYILIISDFYYENSAKNLLNDLNKKPDLKNISILKINDTKYRLLAGPFKNFNTLKTTYISLNNLGFEDLNINIK